MNDNFLFFTVGHKHHYGASQGQYSRLYIAIDTDRQMGSGAIDLPDSSGARVSADNAWEYCIYVNGENDFGIITKESFRLAKPQAGNKKMTVAGIQGSDGKYVIKVPVELLGSPREMAFTVATVKPGATGETQVCDVSTMGAVSAEDGLISGSHQVKLAELDGGSSSTTTTEGFIYDGSNTACDLDENGQIVRKYLYANGKHLAMQTRATSYGPYGNACEDTAGFHRGGDSAPITINLNSDCSQGAWSVQVNVGAGNYGNFGFADQNIAFSSQTYRYVHLWVKPLTTGSWLSFHCWDTLGNRWLGMNGDKDGNETYETGEDLVAGQWNEVWVDLLQNSQGFAGGPVRSFHMHSSPNSQFLIDGIYTVTQPWQTFYYHCDYLGSPRLMTDAAGNVVWKQDYSAFGGDLGTPATGNTHKFTGHVQDAATGQYYAKARYFTTGLGRWSQPEPLLKGVPPRRFLVNPQKLNPYSYCLNNPNKYVDPDGKETKIYSLPIPPTSHRHLFIVVKNTNTYTSKGLYPKNWFAAVKSLIPFLKGGTPEVRTDLDTELGEVKKLDSGGKSNARYEATISPPSGMTTEQHDQAVIDAADKYPVGKKTYDADQGPNSNTFVDDVIESTGAIMPDIPGATQQNYGENNNQTQPTTTSAVPSTPPERRPVD